MNAQEYDLSVAYDYALQRVSYTFGTVTLIHNYALPARKIDSLFLRTTAVTANSAATLKDLSVTQSGFTLNLGSIISSATRTLSAPAGQVSYVQIGGLDPFASWTLTGKAQMIWGATAPANSSLAFQIKYGELHVATPEPSTLLTAGVALATLSFAVRRKKSA